jgi:hypothetical protein
VFKKFYKKEEILSMKKLLWISAVVFCVVSVGGHGRLFAEVTEFGKSHLEAQAGVAGTVKGEVKATTPPAKNAHLLKTGDKIFMGDKIETGAEGQLQIQLLDQTFFILGPLSTIMVDEFIYDPKNAGTKASVAKGIFRAVSSKMTEKITENTPDSGGPDTVRADPGASSPAVQENASALAELGNAIDAVDAPAIRGNESSESQKQQT